MTRRLELPFDEPAPEPEPDPGPAPGVAPDARRPILTVAQLTASIRELLEGEFVEIWVDGEISNFRPWHTGHLYFTLKDEQAQLRAVMFRSAVRSLRFTPEDGLRVIVRGRISLYDRKGEYQIVCEHMEPRGLGALQLAFEQRRLQLQREGLFDAGRKRPLPTLPRKIGVVTSLQGAALHDILHVLRRRHSSAHVIISPARVQGEGAAMDIARAVAAIVKVPGVDVLIVGRGGGSIEDLWAFNEEPVARAIAASPIPVISAVGHESDVTIADFVADLRAPTPSAAAELVVARTDEFTNRIDRLRDRIRSAAWLRIQGQRRRLHGSVSRPSFAGFAGHLAVRGRHVAELTHDVRQRMRDRLTRAGREHQDLTRRLDRTHPGRRLAAIRTRLQLAHAQLAAQAAVVHRRHEGRLRSLTGRLDALSPLGVLARGYAVCWDETRSRIVRDAAGVPSGATVHVTLARGELTCRVTERDDRAVGDRT